MATIYKHKDLCNCKICDYKYGCPLKNTRFEEMSTEWGFIPLRMCNTVKAGLIIQGLERPDAYIMRLREVDTLENYLQHTLDNRDIMPWETIGQNFIKLFIMLHHEETDLKKMLEFIPEPYRAYKDSFFDEYGRVKKSMIDEF